jgi:uncharacterized small protein (DUF1192 family)
VSLKYYIEESRKNCSRESEGPLLDEELKLGCLMRIANSLEKMERPHAKASETIEMLQRGRKAKEDIIINLDNRIAGLKSYITRLKKERNTPCQEKKKSDTTRP